MHQEQMMDYNYNAMVLFPNNAGRDRRLIESTASTAIFKNAYLARPVFQHWSREGEHVLRHADEDAAPDVHYEEYIQKNLGTDSCI